MSSITSAPFGKTHEGDPVEIYTLRNNKGMETRIMTYGGAVVSLTAPDRHGKYDDVVLGHDSLDEYLKFNHYFGCFRLSRPLTALGVPFVPLSGSG